MNDSPALDPERAAIMIEVWRTRASVLRQCAKENEAKVYEQCASELAQLLYKTVLADYKNSGDTTKKRPPHPTSGREALPAGIFYSVCPTEARSATALRRTCRDCNREVFFDSPGYQAQADKHGLSIECICVECVKEYDLCSLTERPCGWDDAWEMGSRPASALENITPS